MARLIKTTSWLVSIFLCFFAIPAYCSVPQAFLIQNSGWMEPFYVDPNSQLKPLAAAIAQATTNPGEAFFVSAFSQHTTDNPSPQLLFPNANNLSLQQAIANIEVAHKTKTSPALADTDFQEAVFATIENQFQRKSGIIWIFTNNRNSPNNDQDTARRNQEFYNLLHSEPSITRTIVYNLAMSVKGKIYPQARGLMIYALAYGAAAETPLNEIISSPRLKAILTTIPARLKPLDSESVRLIPTEILNSPSVKIALAKDQKTTILEVDASDRQPSVTVKADMENLFYPYQIDTAHIAAEFRNGSGIIPLSVSPQSLKNLLTGAKQNLSVQFPIPHTQIPSAWSLSNFLRFGTQLQIPGDIIIYLTEQRLSLDPYFIEGLRKNFPGDPISNMYEPAREAKNSQVTVPVSIRVNYPTYPLLILLSILLLLLLVLLFVLLYLNSNKLVELIADGQLVRVSLKRLESKSIHSARGEIIGEIKRGLVNPEIVRVVSGHTLRLK